MEKNFDLLTLDQVANVGIFKKYSEIAAINDFAILTGAFCVDDYQWSYTSHDKKGQYESQYNYRSGDYFTKTVDEKTGKYYAITPGVNSVGIKGPIDCIDLISNTYRRFGLRPCVPYSQIASECTDEKIVDGVPEVCFGEYVQCESHSGIKELEQLFQNGKLTETGKEYTANSIKTVGEIGKKGKDLEAVKNLEFQPRKFKEYLYKGNKYIRIVAEEQYIGLHMTLCNGRRVDSDDKKGIAWLQVKPIVWLVDKEADLAVAKRVLIGGISPKESKMFLDNYFAKEIIPSTVNELDQYKDSLLILKDKVNRLQYLQRQMNSEIQDMSLRIKELEESDSKRNGR